MEEITSRRFGQWSMALVYLSKDDPMVQMAHPEFDPYSTTAKDAMSLLKELIETSTPIVTVANTWPRRVKTMRPKSDKL